MEFLELEDRVFCSVTSFNEFGHFAAKAAGCKIDPDHLMEPKIFTGSEFCPEFTVIKDGRMVDRKNLEEMKQGKSVVDGRTVYIIANPDHHLSAQETLGRILFTTDAAKQNGADKVVLIQSDLGYGRQDRSPREDVKLKGQSYAAYLQAKVFHAAGIDNVLTMHLHSNKIYHAFGQAYMRGTGDSLANERLYLLGKLERHDYDSESEKSEFESRISLVESRLEKKGRKIVYNLDPNWVLAHYLLNRSSLDTSDLGDKVVFIAPDKGAKVNIDRLRALMFLPNSSVAYCKKVRESPNDFNDVIVDLDGFSDNFTGIAGKYILIADDIVDTGGTLTQCMKGLLRGYDGQVPAGIYLCFTHAVLASFESENNFQTVQRRLGSVDPTEIVMFNTHPYIEDHRIPKWKERGSVLRIANLMADAVHCVEEGIPLSQYYKVRSREELDAKFGKLYDVKRSSMHFLRNAA